MTPDWGEGDSSVHPPNQREGSYAVVWRGGWAVWFGEEGGARGSAGFGGQGGVHTLWGEVVPTGSAVRKTPRGPESRRTA